MNSRHIVNCYPIPQVFVRLRRIIGATFGVCRRAKGTVTWRTRVGLPALRTVGIAIASLSMVTDALAETISIDNSIICMSDIPCYSGCTWASRSYPTHTYTFELTPVQMESTHAELTLDHARVDFLTPVTLNGVELGTIFSQSEFGTHCWTTMTSTTWDVTSLLSETNHLTVTANDGLYIAYPRLTLEPPPDIRVTGTWDKDYYNCDDTANLYLDFQSLVGSAEIQYEIVGERVGLVAPTILGPFSVQVAEQVTSSATIPFPVEVCEPTVHYVFTLQWQINGVTQPDVQLPDFVAHDIDGNTIDLYVAEGVDCSEVTPGNVCSATAFEMIPVIGIAAALPAEVARQCLMHSYAREGRYKYHNAINFADGAATLGTILGPNEYWLEAAGKKSVAKLLVIPTAIATGVACGTALGDWFDPAKAASDTLPTSMLPEFVDSLATVMPEVNYRFRHTTVVANGTASTSVGDAYTTPDTLGLKDVVDYRVPPFSGYAVFVKANPVGIGTTDTNPTAAIELEIIPEKVGDLGLSSALFDTSGVSIARYDWLIPDVSPMTRAYLRIGLEYPILVVRLDSEGDGVIDEWVYPMNTAVSAPRMASSVLHSAIPNPFNPSTQIQFDLGATGQATLSIYDLSGRLVRALVDESLSAGPHSVTWNGKDDSGRQVASGVYLYRLRAGDYTETKRMVLLK